MVEVVVDRCVDGDKFLQTSHSSEAEHFTFSSSEWQVRILGPIVEPAPCFLAICVADDLHPGAIGPKFAGHNYFRVTMAFHCVDFLRNLNAHCGHGAW